MDIKSAERVLDVMASAIPGAWTLTGMEQQAIRTAIDEIGRLRAERDALISGLVYETWRNPGRTLANVDDSGVMEHGWEWRYGPQGDFERTREVAVSAVRRAAGLDPSGGPP